MTKANRRRRKMGGRPRLEGVTREPNGRPLRSERKTETEKEARAVVIEARQRHFGGTEAECAKEEYGSVLGRLLLKGLITKRQYSAGNNWSIEYFRYCCLTGVQHPSPKAQDLTRVKGMGGDVDFGTARNASTRMMKVEELLGAIDVSGRPITSVTKRVCIQDDGTGLEYAHMRGWLAKGLNLLADYYGIEQQDAA